MLMPGFNFYEVKKKYHNFSKRKGKYFYTFYHSYYSYIELISTNLLLWCPICRNKRASTEKWIHSLKANFAQLPLWFWHCLLLMEDWPIFCDLLRLSDLYINFQKRGHFSIGLNECTMHTWFNWMFITHCLSLWFIKPANSSCSCKFRRCALWFDEFSRPDCCAKSKAGIPVDKLGSCPPPDPPPLDELRRAPRKMFWVWTCPGILRQSCGNSRSEIQKKISKTVLTYCEKKYSIDIEKLLKF